MAKSNGLEDQDKFPITPIHRTSRCGPIKGKKNKTVKNAIKTT